jgi:hypothetical protein
MISDFQRQSLEVAVPSQIRYSAMELQAREDT